MVQKNSQLMSSDDLYIRIKLRIIIWVIKNECDFCNVIYSDILSFEAVFLVRIYCWNVSVNIENLSIKKCS